MIKTLEKLGDRLLGRVVPQVTARANPPQCPWYCGCKFGYLAYSQNAIGSCGRCGTSYTC
ncbi:hypothetical protein Raf01_75320 [Rugosimonospora africana]|uniref:Uncharacterized protein n=1 Tax=Rugosimonospora africana TaxID=556532 RepID=A0A8J3VUK7_9ACTN|nr:hypothetical protein Raf01_75320 [Rugosimonospora africana]